MSEVIQLLDVRHSGYVKAYHEVLYAKISDGAFRTYLVLLRYAMIPDSDGVVEPKAWVGQDRVSVERDIDVRTIRRHVEELEHAHLIHTIRRPNKSNSTSVLQPPLIDLPFGKRTGQKCPVQPKVDRTKMSGTVRTKMSSDLERGIKKERSGGAKCARTPTSRKGSAMDVGLWDGDESETHSSSKRKRSSNRVVSSDDKTKVQQSFIEKFGLDGFNRFRAAWKLVQPVTSEQSNVFHDALSCLVKSEKVVLERFDEGVKQFTERAKTGGFEARGRKPSRDALLGFIDHARIKDEEVTWEPYSMDGPTDIFCVGVKEGAPKTDSNLLFECAWCRARLLPKQKVCRCGAPLGWDQVLDVDKWRAIQRGEAATR